MASGHLVFFFLVPLVFFGWVDGAHEADPAPARPCPRA
jgi:hypothetical protein